MASSRVGGSRTGQVLRDRDGQITGALEVVQPLHGYDPEGLCDEPARSEPARIEQALRETRYNRTQAAQRLGMSRTTLWRKMREYGL